MKATEFSALIFDIDGTLWDTCELCLFAWQQTLEMHQLDSQIPVDLTLIKSMMGKTGSDIESIIFSEVGKSKGRALLNSYYQFEIDNINHADQHIFYPDVLDGIKLLSEKFELHLVSNCDEAYLDCFLGKSALSPYFKDMECFGRSKEIKGKNIAHVMQRNNLSNLCYIGDTQTDEQAARYANIPLIYAAYGFGECESYYKSVDSFSELVHFFNQDKR